jgi:hypothetical protein
MQVPDEFFDKFASAELSLRHERRQEEDLAMTRAALAMCENIDHNLGRVLAKLDELKLADHTIVLYMSDNGPNSIRWNGGMKGRKGSTDEGGVRSPLLVRWPAHVPAGSRIGPIAGAIDLLPTLAELAGVKVQGAKPLDGKSLAPLLLAQQADWPDRTIFSHWNGQVSARTDRYRLDAAGKLFDLPVDPGQRRDIAREQPAIAARLAGEVDTWRREVLAELTREPRPFPVGYREFPMTVLPARDAVPHGNVRRSARPPNCSFLENWTSTDDRITWDVEVHTSGQYTAEVLYTCPAVDAGSIVELSLGSRRVQATVREAFDPPLRGARHDRVPRNHESYVKDFAPLKLGTIALPHGRAELTLRALKIPGKRAMDVRLLRLTLAE